MGGRGLILGALIASLVLAMATLGAAEAAAPPLAGIEVHLPPDTGDRAHWVRMVKDLSLLKIGESLTQARLAEVRTTLELSGRFKEIALEVQEDRGQAGRIVGIRVTPYRRIRRIRIKGHYPLFESEVRRALPVYPGDPYHPDQLDAIRHDVEAVYRRVGYLDPRVMVGVDGDGEGHRLLTVAIDKGTPRRLADLTIQGNRAFGTTRLKWKFGVWRDSLKPWHLPLSEDRLKQDIEKLEAFYRRKNFADAQIEYTLAPSSDGRAVTVAVRIPVAPHISSPSRFHGEGIACDAHTGSISRFGVQMRDWRQSGQRL